MTTPTPMTVTTPNRKRLPDTRPSMTSKNAIGAFEFYVTVGFYEDDTPGEVFIQMAKEGSVLGGMCDALALTVSLALQHGVQWPVLSDHFRGMRFEPLGLSLNQAQQYNSIPGAIADTVDHILRTRASLMQ